MLEITIHIFLSQMSLSLNLKKNWKFNSGGKLTSFIFVGFPEDGKLILSVKESKENRLNKYAIRGLNMNMRKIIMSQNLIQVIRKQMIVLKNYMMEDLGTKTLLIHTSNRSQADIVV